MLHLKFFSVIFIAAAQISTGESARILAVAPLPSYSHQVAYRPIWKELSLKGHNVTVITTDPMNDPHLVNLTEIDIHDCTYNIWLSSGLIQKVKEYRYNPFKLLEAYEKTFDDLTHAFLTHPGVKTILKDDVHFDLVMTEPILPIGLGIAERFKSKLILVMSLEAPTYIHSALGNAVHPILYPETAMADPPTTFLKRTFSALFYAVQLLMINSFFDKNTKKLSNYLGEELPPFTETLEKVSMLFVNSNPLFGYVRPVTPSTVYFGRGSHLQPEKPLPEDLQRFLDTAKDGVIYFSLGTNVLSKDLSDDIKRLLLDSFAELPFKFLWKFEDDTLKDIPSNVKISKWLPQQDILRHRNIKAFITQGGLQSTEEAIFCNVPLIGIPQVADQLTNVQTVVELGMGVHLDFNNLEKETFKKVIVDVAANSSYREKMKEFVRLSSDWPMGGIEEVVWWTEYVLRHNNTEHIKGPARKIPTYQFLLLDVIATALVVTFVFVYLVKKILGGVWKLIVSNCLRRKEHKE